MMKKFLLFVAAALTSLSMMATSTTVTWVPTEADVTSLVSGTTHSVTVGTGNNSFEVRAARYWSGDNNACKLAWANPGVQMTDNAMLKAAVAVWVDGACNDIENIVFYLHTSKNRKAYYYAGTSLTGQTGTITDDAIATTSTGYTPWGTTFAKETYYVMGGKNGGSGDSYYDSIKVTFTEGTAATRYTVSYYDGTTLLGTESVKENETPANYANYQAKSHATFDNWYNEADFQTVADFTAAITADKAFYGKWTAEAFTASSSLNIEQGVLDNSTKWDINAALAEHHIVVDNLTGLDSLNSSKTSNNEPYLGMKFKTANAYAEAGLNAGDILRVKFGNIGCAVNVSGLTEATIATDAAKVFEYTATAQGYVRFTTSGSGTVVLKQIMINDTIEAVTLPGDTVTPTPTPTPSVTTVHAINELIMSNGYHAWAASDTTAIHAYYLAGTQAPTIQSYKLAKGETLSLNAAGDSIIVKGADTVVVKYPFVLKAVSAASLIMKDTVTFDGTETYIASGYGFDATKKWRISKIDTDYSREWAGKTHIEFFLPACNTIYLKEPNVAARNVNVYVNGDSLTNFTQTKNGWSEIAVNQSAPFMLSIYSNQTGGDGGFGGIILSDTVPPIKYTITCTTPENGSLKASASSAVAGTEITLTVKASSGYEIDTVYVNDAEGNAVALGSDYKFTMPASNVTATATFKAKAATYSITCSYGDNGKVTASAKTATEGTKIKLTVKPSSYYEVDSLYVTPETAIDMTDTSFVMPASDVTVRATFKAILYTVTIADMENGTVTADPMSAAKGDSVQLTVTPAAGYKLNKLSVKNESGSSVTVKGTNKFAMPASNVTVSATFIEESVVITQFTVSYYDGENLLGSEKVDSAATPVEYGQYETKARATFDGWYNDADFQSAADFTAAITADKAFYGKWTEAAFVASTSLNIEQGVLDNGKTWDIAAELNSHHITVYDMDALDSLNSVKDANNEPYLGLKMKKATSYLEVGLNQGDVLRVKFGNIGCEMTVTLPDGSSTSIATDAAKVFTYTATAQGYVKFANTAAKTVTLKQIMINEEIKDVVLPSALNEVEAQGKAQKFMQNGKLYILKGGKVYDAAGKVVK